MRKVIVTGGELYNKGAQAMSFICVDEIAKRWPDHSVLLLSSQDAKRSQDEKDNYRFEILPQPGMKEYTLLWFRPVAFLFSRVFKNKRICRWNESFKEADLWLDISGYGLGSYWKPAKAVQYMLNVAIAKSRKIPIYLMPQSFGPFDYYGLQGSIANGFIRHYFSSVKLAMAREKEGEKLLKEKYNAKNVVKTPDMVLQNSRIDYENVYRVLPEKKVISIEDNSVAIIPNVRNNKYGEDKMMDLYRHIIEWLLGKGFNVSLVYHAVEDQPVCKKIKDMFGSEQKVRFIDAEITGIEMEDVMSRFCFVIGSRFHSIVHSYKSYVPAVVLGWATKYVELLEDFGQERFMFDMRSDVDLNNILESIDYMTENYMTESERIRKHILDIREGNVFDLIRL